MASDAAARLTSQRLAGPPATSVTEVVDHLLSIQAQDPRGMRLAIRSRSTGLTAADVDRALTEERSAVVAWLQRGTLHLVTAADYWWLRPLFAARQQNANARRLEQEAVSPRQADRGTEVVVDALAEGPQTRAQLRARLDDAGVPTAGQAIVQVLVAASIRHPIVRGPVIDGELAFVDAERWLEPAAPLDSDEALARLATRYLRGHRPATDRDLAAWTGLPLRDVRRGLEVAAIDPRTGVDDAPQPLPSPRLLGPFDPVLHGWSSREWVVGPHKDVVTTNGLFRPTALVDGRVVATWGLAGGELTIRPLEEIDPGTMTALEADAERVIEFSR